MIDLQVIRTRAAARMAALETQTPAKVAKRLIEETGVSHLAGLASDAACAAIQAEPDLAAVAWTAADITAFLDRRKRLLRWGWTKPEAEALAERLVMRDRADDDRVSCGECQHYRPGLCGNHRRAGLHGSEVGRDLAGLLQRCTGFAREGG